jgi:hypothetical protein
MWVFSSPGFQESVGSVPSPMLFGKSGTGKSGAESRFSKWLNNFVRHEKDQLERLGMIISDIGELLYCSDVCYCFL